EESVTGLLAKERSGGDGPMAESLAATATTAMFVAGLNLEQLRAMAPESELPPDLRGLHKTQTVSLRVDRSEAGWQAQLSLSFANEADADAGLNAARKLLEMGRAAVATALQEVDGVRNQRQV
ncbi:MAG TPA: hypothetical protein PKD86_13235, partial [Gemmatales bacterium]|nr:hypothetical protein [Gemmatales bacterium]